MCQRVEIYHPILPLQQSCEVDNISFLIFKWVNRGSESLSYPMSNSWIAIPCFELAQSDFWACIQNPCHAGRRMWFQEVFSIEAKASNILTLINPKAQETTEGTLKTLLSPKCILLLLYQLIINQNQMLYSSYTFKSWEKYCVNLRKSELPLSLWVPPTT